MEEEIEEKKSKNFFKKLSKKAKIVCGIVIIVLLAIFVIFGINRKSTVDTAYLTELLTRSSELTTAKLTIKGLSEYHDEGIYLFNKSDFTLYYTTTIKAGINLENVKITTDSIKKKIYITIPKAEIFEAKVDTNDIKIFGSGFAIFNTNEKEDMAKAISLAEEDAKEYAKTTGILELANDQSEALIKGLLTNAIPSGYTLEVIK